MRTDFTCLYSGEPALFTKDPGAKLDYTIDWGSGGWMPAGDAIASAAWSTDETYLLPPGFLTASGAGTGGTLTAGTYYYVVTAINAAGETVRSAEAQATVTGSTSLVVLGWNGVTGATGYKVYRGTATGGENKLIATINSATTESYIDTGAAGTSATPPVSNTASQTIDIADSPAPSTTSTTATAWIEGGTAGGTFTATCTMTTTDGRVDVRAISIAVVDAASVV